MTELRKISAEELKEILEKHVVWLKKKDRESSDPLRADLSLTDLSGVNLIGANLSGAVFSGADLGEADLFKTNLSEANLSGANLFRANLSDADLSRAYLIEANLTKANLRGSNLSGADLEGANLSKANVSRVEYDRKGKYQGVWLKTFYGNMPFKKHAQRQDYLEELKDNHPIIYIFWNFFANHGRVIWHSAVWLITFSILFASIYYGKELLDFVN